MSGEKMSACCFTATWRRQKLPLLTFRASVRCTVVVWHQPKKGEWTSWWQLRHKTGLPGGFSVLLCKSPQPPHRRLLSIHEQVPYMTKRKESEKEIARLSFAGGNPCGSVCAHSDKSRRGVIYFTSSCFLNSASICLFRGWFFPMPCPVIKLLLI